MRKTHQWSSLYMSVSFFLSLSSNVLWDKYQLQQHASFTYTWRNGICFRYSSHLSCVFCTLPLKFLALLLLLLVWVVVFFCRRRCCWCWCCLLCTVLITVAAVANLKYSGECVSSSWKTFSMEFSLSHVRLVRYVLTRKSNYSKYVKKDPPQFEIRATCTWKHVFKSLSATYVYISKLFLHICSDLSIFAIVHALSTVVYLFFWFFFF